MRKTRSTALAAATVLLFAGGILPAAGSRETADNGGFLYGTVHTKAGREYTGLLRWDDEEAFRDDLFNAGKQEMAYAEWLPEDRRKRREMHILGIEITYDWSEADTGRQFIARFGDIREIRPRGGDKLDVVMKNGTAYRLEGGSNDVGATVIVQDAEVGDVEVAWKKIDRVVFSEVPAAVRPEVRRLQGEVATRDGTFRGFIQWDSQECLSSDRLDGHSEDGKVSIEMGRIRSIARKGRNASTVTLADGRTFELRGTNDVNSEIRGILVEDERYGRVKISWDVFRRADFIDAAATGRGDAAYSPATPLRGTLTRRDGTTLKGRLAFDLDETESFEMLNGDRDGVEYNIPFELVRSIEPIDDASCKVALRSGVEVRLEDSQDVTGANAGVLVIPGAGGSETYVAWDEVRRIDFD